MTPDLDFLFLSAKHREAISCMEFGVMEDIGIILLTGEIGTGKTTLIRHILEGIENDIEVAAIYNTNVNSEQLLASIMEEYGLDSRFENKIRAIKTLQSHLRGLRSLKRKPLLIIDDAQNLSLEALEEVRLLSNLQNSVRMLVQIILVGQPELEKKLGDPNASSLAQRVSISYHLLPFSQSETEEYIIHRLKKAGGPTDIFSKSAMEMIYSAARGIPRSINLLCDNALSSAFSKSLKTIDLPCIKEILKTNKNRGFRSGNTLSPKQIQNTRFQGQTKPAATKAPPKNHSNNWQYELNQRMDALEQLVAASNRELKSLLKKERQRNDKLLIAYTHLKSKYDALHKTQMERKRLRADMSEGKSLVRSAGAGRRVTRLITSKNR